MTQRPGARADGVVPTPATSFVGRRAQLAGIRDRLQQGRHLTLVGPGGVGKTRLALQGASEMRRAFDDGVCVVELASVSTDDVVASAVVHALGISDQSFRDPTAKILDHLAGRELLLLLDNCEHVLDGVVRLVSRILRSTSSVRTLATSRSAFGITEETLYPVPCLSTPGDPGPDDGSSTELEQFESVRLFLDRAEAAVPGFRLTDVNAAAVRRLCTQLEGIPLAIELAVARLRTMSLDQIVDRLSDRFGLLTTGSRVAEPRQQTLRSLIDWSYALCSPAERRLWARLSVFAGGFDLDAAEGVCGDDAAGEDALDAPVLDLLGSLADQSVVTAEHDGDTVRFRMLETIREYGAEHLDRGDARELTARHRAYFLRWAGAIASRWCGPGQELTVGRLRTEQDNLRAVMDNCTRDGAHAEAVQLVAALRYRWYADGYIAQGRRWSDEALDRSCAPDAPRSDRITALWSAAWVCLLQGERCVAQRRIEECDRLAQAQGDPVGQAYVLKLRGLDALFSGELASAAVLYDDAVRELDGVGEVSGMLAASFQYALVLCLDHRFTEAEDVGERALAISEKYDERWCRSYIQWVRGVHAWLEGDVVRADELGRAALDSHRVFKLSVGTALMTELLAWAARSAGDDARSAELLGGADALWKRTGTGIAAFGPHLSGHHADCEAAARRALHPAEFRRAYDRGAASSNDETVAFALGEASRAPVPRAAEPGPLTPRQVEIARLVAQGMSNREIAGELVLSVRTVESHLENILDRLGFSTRAQVAAWFAGRATPVPG